MSSIIVTIRKFLTNKNTVTVIGVIAAILVLYVGYNWRVRSAVNPISVPYAKKTINPGVQITQDMIGTIEVPPSMLKGDVIRNRASVLDKYSQIDSVIPAGSLFYGRSVVEKEQIKTQIILDYPDGYVLYYLPVNMETTFSNSIYPGNYIDIYLKVINKLEGAAADQKDKIMVGKLIQNIKVLAVRDASGQDVFENLDENRVPSQIIFAVPEEYNILLLKAKYLRSYDATLLPVPTAESLKEEPGEVNVSNEQLKEFINNATAWTGE